MRNHFIVYVVARTLNPGVQEWENRGYLSIYLASYLFVLQVMTSKPSQHTMSDPNQSAHKMPFKRHFAGGPTLARFFMFSFDVSFDIMRKWTIIFSDKHFWCSKESSRWDGSFEHQKLTLKVIEKTILHTTRPSVRSSVRTIPLFVFVLRSNISALRI